ncbi:MAG: YbfB/YjiJ family MFS transporter [Acidimicrobiia bacterium]|nr:YbfB/YjiJ family MFS transporter [Acidimicrobiia bacterium]MDQ3499960.1 YbfB/YjiJ family MFS transporter [Actinomycetota bacterium]
MPHGLFDFRCADERWDPCNPAWAAAIGRLTVIFGFGQILGPVIAGLFGDSRSGLRAGLAFSAITLAAGTLVALSITPLPPTAANA